MPPQPLEGVPQVAPRDAQVAAVQDDAPQTLGPPPPQVCPEAQVPQLRVPPQPSERVPHVAPMATQVFGVQAGALHAPLVHPSPLEQTFPHAPQFSGSARVDVQMPPQRVPVHVVASPEACILYSTSRLASAPTLELQLDPLRREACSVAPAAKAISIPPLSDQDCPGSAIRSWPCVPSVNRNTPAGQFIPIGVLSVTAMRSTVMA